MGSVGYLYFAGALILKKPGEIDTVAQALVGELFGAGGGDLLNCIDQYGTNLGFDLELISEARLP